MFGRERSLENTNTRRSRLRSACGHALCLLQTGRRMWYEEVDLVRRNFEIFRAMIGVDGQAVAWIGSRRAGRGCTATDESSVRSPRRGRIGNTQT